MPLNQPNTTKSRISFGPAKVYIGAAGTTPSTDIGAISEEGVGFEFQAESRDISQGNPRIPELSFFTSQGIQISVTTLEWNVNTMLYGLGAGNTTISGSAETFAYGGDPCKDEIAIRVEHRKCTATHTIFIDVWKAVSADGTLAVQMGMEEHQFAWTWKGLRSATNWAGAALAFDEQLMKATIQLT